MASAPTPTALVDTYLAEGWAAAYTRLVAMIEEDPAALTGVVADAMARLPESVTWFTEAVAFVSLEDLQTLVAPMMTLLSGSAGPKSPAAALLEVIAEQAPHLLTPHLSRLWELRESYHFTWRGGKYPWRAADAAEGERLLAAVDDDAALALIETADPRLLRRLFDTPWAAAKPAWWVSAVLQTVGLDSNLEPLAPEACYHLLFPSAVLDAMGDGVLWLQPRHPTWRGTPVADASLGGGMTNACGLCHQPMHRLLNLPRVPDGLGVSLRSLELATCLSCLGWDQDVIFQRHDSAGSASAFTRAEQPITPEFVAEPVPEIAIGLAATPQRWLRQEWGSSNGRQNLNRLGGIAGWVQDPQHPDCPDCGRTMSSLLQLDSIPLPGGHEFLWGSGGLGYLLWCDACSISAALWQCT